MLSQPVKVFVSYVAQLGPIMQFPSTLLSQELSVLSCLL